MQNLERKISKEQDRLYRSAEEEANRFCLTFLIFLLIFSALSEVLNELGMFAVPKNAMRINMAVSALIFMVPLSFRLINDRILKRKPPMISRPWFKVVILTSIFIGIGELSVLYTHHTLLLLAVPPLIMAQYYKQHRLFWWTFAGMVLLAPISVYGGYFFGNLDRNLLKEATEATNFNDRLAALTPHRAMDLFLHYVIPREFCVLIIVALTVGTSRRSERLLAKQEELIFRVQDEMQRRNEIQAHVIEAMATLIETRDEGTGEHVLRTKKYVSMIAHAMKNDEWFRDRMTPEEIDRIENAAPLHDIGKIAISDTILLKPGKLTPEEFEKMKSHTVKGEHMIGTLFAQMDDPLFLKTAEDIVIAHHEKWDGTGYPYGKKGEEIPLSARIMAVADVYDALVSYRVYKPSISPEQALETIYAESGTHFDPEIIRIVKKISREMIEMANAPLEQK